MGLASRMFSSDANDGAYANELTIGEDNLNFEYPTYIQDVKFFICPATQNRVRTNVFSTSTPPRQLTDLRSHARTTGSTNGHSYEVYGWYDNPSGPDIKKIYASVNKYALAADHGYVNLRGTKPGAVNTFIIFDADDADAAKGGTPPSYNNWPDETDNHGRTGNNVAFCDGHAEFIKELQWRYRFVLGNDVAPPVPPWSQDPFGNIK
jgi:prepilin-type processing-associated H-X9-DG protein